MSCLSVPEQGTEAPVLPDGRRTSLSANLSVRKSDWHTLGCMRIYQVGSMMI